MAGRFAAAWWSYDWRDPPGALECRVATLTTPVVATELSDAAMAPALDAASRAAHRIVRVGAPSVTIADRSPGGVGVAVTAPVTVTGAGSGAGGVSARWAMEVLVVAFHHRWVVARIDQ